MKSLHTISGIAVCCGLVLLSGSLSVSAAPDPAKCTEAVASVEEASACIALKVKSINKNVKKLSTEPDQKKQEQLLDATNKLQDALNKCNLQLTTAMKLAGKSCGAGNGEG